MHICSCLWALGIFKNNWFRSHVGPVTVDSVGGFNYFAFLRHGSKLAGFLNCIFFETHPSQLSQSKIWQSWIPGPKIYKGFTEPPYNIVISYLVGGHHYSCVLRSLVVTKIQVTVKAWETWLLEPVSPRMHASPIFFEMLRFLTDSDQSVPLIGRDHP